MLYFNGVDAETGEYAFPPAPPDEIARIAAASIAALETGEPAHLAELKRRQRALNTPDYAPVEGVDPKDLAQTGWGAIFAHDAGPAVKAALKPLLDLRRSQASRIKETRYRELIGGSDGDSKPEFLDRNGAGGGGAVDPDQIPYYLLIVGSPESIPFPFQYQLDVQYAVGRLYFDRLDDYARYAQSVVEAESGRVKRAKRAAFFGVANPGDPATLLSASELIAPLAKLMEADQPSWKIDTIAPSDATKARLAQLMGGPDTPALLFTASHGMLFRNGSPLQAAHMGALLCGDWPGPAVKGLVPPDWYFSGSDLSSDAGLLGMIAFHFACFGAATPQFDDYAEDQTRPDVLAPRPFVANLPQRLLGHPKGGALASVGHVDRAWGYSFKSANSDAQLRVFKSTLKRLMEGHPVGSALEYFNNRYAELSSDLSTTVRSMKYGKKVDPADLSVQWTFNNDARNYVVIGDPAVRLPLAGDPAQERKSMIETSPISVTTPPSAPERRAAAAVDYGFFSAEAGARSTLQELASTLTAKIGEAVNAVATVQVKTYSTASLNDKPGLDPFIGANLRAISEIRLDGNARICVPEKDGQIDDALWKLHSDMVDKALANRIEMFKLAASAASRLIGALKQL